MTGLWPDLTWGQTLKLTFQVKNTCFEPARRGKHDGIIFIFYLSYQKVINKKTISLKTISFIWWSLEPKLFNSGQIWWQKVARTWIKLTIVFFLILPGYHTFGDNSACLRKNNYFLKIWPLVTSGDLNIDLNSEHDLCKTFRSCHGISYAAYRLSPAKNSVNSCVPWG